MQLVPTYMLAHSLLAQPAKGPAGDSGLWLTGHV